MTNPNLPPLAERYDVLLKEWNQIHNEHRFSVEWYGGRGAPVCSCGEWEGEESRRNHFALNDEWRKKHLNLIERDFRRKTGFMERLRPDDILHTVLGDIENVIGTGRATCRVCLYKITKGERAVRAYVDTGGGGSYTSVLVQAHERCVRPGG